MKDPQKASQVLMEIAFKRLRLLGSSDPSNCKDEDGEMQLMGELARIGYVLPKVPKDLLQRASQIVLIAISERGGNFSYMPLHSFPSNSFEVSERRLADLELRPDFDKTFNISDEARQAALAEQARRGLDNLKNWVEIRVADEQQVVQELKTLAKNLIEAKSSIKQSQHAELQNLLSSLFAVGEFPEFGDVPHRENRAILGAFQWKKGLIDQALSLCDSPTDILRLFAGVTDGDVSLAEKIKFPKLNRHERKMVLAALAKADEAGILAEEMLRYKGLWKQILRYVHPMEYKNQFPGVANAFKRLSEGSLRSFRSDVEFMLNGYSLLGAIKLLKRKPALFARELLRVLRKAENRSDIEAILQEFFSVANKVPLKNLLTLASHVDGLNSDLESQDTAIITKSGKIKVVKAAPLDPATQYTLLGGLEKAMVDILSKKPSWSGKTVWIDEGLSNYVLPFSERAMSDGMLPFARGSRLDLSPDCKVMRLFCYWDQGSGERTDLDLSLLALDEKFNQVGYLSYTCLQGQGLEHSGDVTDAAGGAAEFIDINLDELGSPRYIAMQIYRFCGLQFEELTEAFCGWMERSDPSQKVKTFDTATVRNRFKLKGGAKYSFPLILDVKARQVIVTDLYVGESGSDFNRVEGNSNNICLISEQIARFTECKPNYLQLARLNAIARDANVAESREDADIVFGVDANCEYSPMNPAKVLSELI